MARSEVAPILGKHLVLAKLDVDRTLGGQEMMEALGGKNCGLPWFLFLDGQGQTLGTSGGPGENLGCPWTPEEVAVFGRLLRQVLPGLGDEEWTVLERSFTAMREAQKAAQH